MRVRVVILYVHPLLGHGVERLLESELGCDVVGIGPYGPGSEDSVRRLTPELLVVEQTSEVDVPRLLDALPPVPIMLVSLDSNDIAIYVNRIEVPPPATTLYGALDAVSRSFPARDNAVRTRRLTKRSTTH